MKPQSYVADWRPCDPISWYEALYLSTQLVSKSWRSGDSFGRYLELDDNVFVKMDRVVSSKIEILRVGGFLNNWL